MKFEEITIDKLNADWIRQKKLEIDILRLDKMHPLISGNKAFKLKYHLQLIKQKGAKNVVTFGGAWSNHIIATACALSKTGVVCTGIIRGEEPARLSSTLMMAKSLGMQLHFVSRQAYKDKLAIMETWPHSNTYFIPEGGYSVEGAKGSAEILAQNKTEHYTHIIGSVGTGTMLAGLIMSAKPNQKVIGISSMKNNFGLEKMIANLLPSDNHHQINIIDRFHFGGYGKCPLALIEFINQFYSIHKIPLDIVYTGKLMFAITRLAAEDYFPHDSRLLIIHSGGLQGNQSLGDKVLTF